jgi:hypothetical protein
MIKELSECKRLKELKTDKEALDQAAEGIMRVAEEDPYTRAVILCLIGAIENGNTESLAEVCALFAAQELKAQLEAAKIENTMN